MKGPSPFSALPPCHIREASPKAISGSTSYLRVCLAFHSYPQLIPAFFNRLGFGPPPCFTRASAWPWIDHSASGLLHKLFALLRLGFPPAPGLPSLNLAAYSNSQAHSTKGTPPPDLRQAVTACKSTVSDSISLPFRGSFHLSLTVLCAIGSCRVFSLGSWSTQLQTGFLVPRPTQVLCRRSHRISAYGTLTHSGRPFQ